MPTSTRRSLGFVLALVSFTTCFVLFLSGVSMQVVTKQGTAEVGRGAFVTPIGVIHLPAMIFTVGTLIGIALVVWPRAKRKPE